MDSLSIDLRYSILNSVSELQSLKNLILTCHSFHDAFIAFWRQILERVFLNEVGIGTLGIAVDMYYNLLASNSWATRGLELEKDNFQAFYDFMQSTKIRKKRILSAQGRIGDRRADNDPPVDIEALLRTHRDIVKLTDAISDLVARFAASGKCSEDFVRMNAQPDPLRRRLLYAAHYIYYHDLVSNECVQNEEDDDEMEVVFDIVDKYLWTLWNDLLAGEVKASGLEPGTNRGMDIRYLWGLFGMCEQLEDSIKFSDDLFKLYPFLLFYPNQQYGTMPEVSMYKFLGKSQEMIDRASRYKLVRFFAI